MPAKVILNPYSARWQAQARWPEAEAALRAAGVEFDLVVSERPGHLTELAAQAVRDGFSPIIAAGGDGTIGEVVNGLARAARSPSEPIGPLGILPLGTANDLVSNLGLPTDLAAAARVIAAGHTRDMDLCRANDHYFANNAAVGLEPTVTVIQQGMVRFKGIVRYLVAALTAIMRNPSWQAHIEWDGGSYDGPLSLVTVGNGARTGGVFFMAPHADPFDGKLTFVYAYRPTSLSMLAILPKTMKPGPGSYIEADGVHEINSTWLKVRLDRPSPAHGDGELFSMGLTEVEYRVEPGRLKVLMP